MPLPADVSRDLKWLRTALSLLPPKAPTTGSPYPFEGFISDAEWVENTGSLQGSVNHTLEVAFGSRVAGDDAPIKLRSHGPDLLAVVDVLATSITLAEILIHEVNSGRAPEVFGSYASADEIIQEFRYQYMNYVRQVPPFNRYLNSPTPRQHWEKTGLHDDANIISYLGVKLTSVASTSMAEERTIACFTQINSPNRGRQKTSTLVAMTQVKQHELCLQNTTKDVPSPAVRFRDLSDLMKCPGHAMADLRQNETSGAANMGEGTANAPIMLNSEGEPDLVTDSFDEPDTWEQEIGLDEVIERPPPGA
ncbi:hypothetical protein FRC11_001993 [Ceratobasidium sp. 423]|nr:hypothetical protein FRC11_001993 [Ceratobasidium sp. 423]